MTYKEQLTDPRWQKKRLQILERDKWACQICSDTTTQLQVHHKKYDYFKMAWEYPDYVYQTLCKDCHSAITNHINEYGNVEEFNVLKLKHKGNPNRIITYNNGTLKIPIKNDVNNVYFNDSDTYKIVQFLINNWLKNG